MPYLCLSESVEVEGLCKRSLGATLEYARVRIYAGPSETFSVVSDLESKLYDYIQKDNWLDSAIFGILDVLATVNSCPLFGIEVRILAVEYNEIDSDPGIL